MSRARSAPNSCGLTRTRPTRPLGAAAILKTTLPHSPSYAVFYLGADHRAVAEATSAYPAYKMTAKTDEAVTWIHAGVCW